MRNISVITNTLTNAICLRAAHLRFPIYNHIIHRLTTFIIYHISADTFNAFVEHAIFFAVCFWVCEFRAKYMQVFCSLFCTIYKDRTARAQFALIIRILKILSLSLYCFSLTALGNARAWLIKHLLEIRNNFWNGRSGNQTRHVRARMLTNLLLIANSLSAIAKNTFWKRNGRGTRWQWDMERPRCAGLSARLSKLRAKLL